VETWPFVVFSRRRKASGCRSREILVDRSVVLLWDEHQSLFTPKEPGNKDWESYLSSVS
jgi:hypothetical protein